MATKLGGTVHGPGRRRSLVAHETLFCAGDEGDTVYFVDGGMLEVVHQSADPADVTNGELVVATLGSGDVVGEITAVVGGRRTATVRAGEDGAELRALDVDEYTSWLQGEPDEAQRIAQLARERIDRSRVAKVLTDLIGPGHPDVVEAVNQVLEWRRLEAGELLFSQGDQVGAVQALVDDGEVFDVIAGTSMGSIVGASLALVVDPAELLGQVQHVLDGVDVLDYTLPVVSLAAGDGLYTALLRKKEDGFVSKTLSCRSFACRPTLRPRPWSSTAGDRSPRVCAPASPSLVSFRPCRSMVNCSSMAA